MIAATIDAASTSAAMIMTITGHLQSLTVSAFLALVALVVFVAKLISTRLEKSEMERAEREAEKEQEEKSFEKHM